MTGFRTALPGIALVLATVRLLAGPSGAAAQSGEPPLIRPGDHDFGSTPLIPHEYEVRWITRPATAAADTGFVYMEFEDFLSEGRPAVRATWLPFFGDLGNMDLMILDRSTYAVRYRQEPRAGGAMGIFWYGEARAYAAQVDSTGGSGRAEMALEGPVFSVPTLPWVLTQLASRLDGAVRIELAGFSPGDGGSISRPVLTPGPRTTASPPEGGGTYPARTMRLDFDSGSSWTYSVSRYPPYFLSIVARDAEGAETSRIEVVDWATPALDPGRRIPLILRQSYMDGN